MLPEHPPIHLAVHIAQNKKTYVTKSPKMCRYSVGHPKKNHRTTIYSNFVGIVINEGCLVRDNCLLLIVIIASRKYYN